MGDDQQIGGRGERQSDKKIDQIPIDLNRREPSVTGMLEIYMTSPKMLIAKNSLVANRIWNAILILALMILWFVFGWMNIRNQSEKGGATL